MSKRGKGREGKGKTVEFLDYNIYLLVSNGGKNETISLNEIRMNKLNEYNKKCRNQGEY